MPQKLIVGVNTVYEYTYDSLGNILGIFKDGTRVARYEYDELNQLIREDDVDNNYTYCYTYDLSGNILKKYKFNRSLYPASVVLFM